MAVIDHITTNNSATYEVQDTVARTKANNLESANYTDIGGFADGNTFLVKTNDGMKKGFFNNFANWILDKLATKVYNQLATSNKTMIGALNELDSNTNRIYEDPGRPVSSSSDINAIFNAMNDESISIKRYTNGSANIPESGSGIIITFKDVYSFGWNIAMCNGKVYSRNIVDGGYGNWVLLS